jgi:hypothetical protein
LERLKYPLRSGEYKLKEALYDMVGSLNELERITDYKQTRSYLRKREKGYALKHCTPKDMDEWLQDLPLHIAFTLSYNVIPATLALTGDGVASVDVREMHWQTRYATERLLRDLESARGSTLYFLIADAVRLIDWVLANAKSVIVTATHK